MFFLLHGLLKEIRETDNDQERKILLLCSIRTVKITDIKSELENVF